MIDRSLIRRYVAAIYRLAERDGQIDVVGRQLERLQAAAVHDERTLRVLRHPDITVADKRSLLWAIAGEPPSELVRGLIDVILQKERVDILLGAADAFVQLADEAAGVVRATIDVAWEPDEGRKTSLQQALSDLVGAPVVAEFRLQPELIGGARVRVAGRLIDGSLRGSLDNMLDQIRATPYGQEASV